MEASFSPNGRRAPAGDPPGRVLPFVVLVAPNVSEQMGGEAMKALQILREVRRALPDTVQVTHARNRAEVARLGLRNVHFVEDRWWMRLLWRLPPLRWALGPLFSWRSVRLAEELARARAGGRAVVIHQVEPNSPVMPRWMSRRYVNVLGPVNGNIYYPPAFRRHESASARWRRRLHMPVQWARRCWPVRRHAQGVLVAGGERTRRSLQAAGVPADTLVDTVDCGVATELLDRPRLRHAGANLRFIHFGRLVFHKGTALAIRALCHTRLPVTLDIVGRGPEKPACERLVQALGLQARVRFLDWYERHEDLVASFDGYRGMVLPSLEDANGIVVQEALALGLPPVCLDWGGPQLLVDAGVHGLLVAAADETAIVRGLAASMDRLAADGSLADQLADAGRRRADSWRWSEVIAQWIAVYAAVAQGRRPAPA
jgi:glycosyltransferase involved in cell wall biosynthesis